MLFHELNFLAILRLKKLMNPTDLDLRENAEQAMRLFQENMRRSK
jgi:hypothetical protein